MTPEAMAFLAARRHEAVHAVFPRDGRVVKTADPDYPRLLAAHQAAGPVNG